MATPFLQRVRPGSGEAPARSPGMTGGPAHTVGQNCRTLALFPGEAGATSSHPMVTDGIRPDASLPFPRNAPDRAKTTPSAIRLVSTDPSTSPTPPPCRSCPRCALPVRPWIGGRKGWHVKSWGSLAGQWPIGLTGRKGASHGTGRPAPETGQGEHTGQRRASPKGH